MSPLSPLQPVARRRRRLIRLRWLLVLLVIAGLAAGGYLLVSRQGATDRHGAVVINFTINSRFVHQSLPQVAVMAPGHSTRPRPLLVFLHGTGGDGQDSNLNSQMFAALAAQGSRAPDIVFPDGGDDSYWHNRAAGAWADYVLREVIPRALALTHADSRRIAVGGISMGGFGALDIARSHRGRFCAVGAHSAAVWVKAADAAPGAFDNARDFARHDLLAVTRASNPYGQVPIWLDVGRSDPFHAADAALAHQLHAHGARVHFTSWSGGHDSGYWQSHWGSYLHFYARALAACRRR